MTGRFLVQRSTTECGGSKCDIEISTKRPKPEYGCCVTEKKDRKTNFLLIKTNRRTNFPNLFCQKTLHVSGSSSAHHQEFYTVYSALVYVMQF